MPAREWAWPGGQFDGGFFFGVALMVQGEQAVKDNLAGVFADSEADALTRSAEALDEAVPAAVATAWSLCP